ncbi:F0F1 ATP synthase subunit alpha [Patescibacteria group bacterium]|nr:F0F1 ATP synthase subunit alpha [Patescibacteria group bacterium]MCG2687692.1 F0F1 ATP synthase subunit alpha [Candidatus Parcubacteria bacterium]
MAQKQQIIEELRKQIDKFKSDAHVESVGTVLSVADGVVRLSGLSQAKSMELLEFPGGVMGLALNVEEESIGAIVLGSFDKIDEGDTVKSTGRILSIPVNDQVVGRVVDPLGRPLDGKGEISTDNFQPIEKIAPGVITRKSVSVPLHTGLKAIDALIPIGRGQRELIIGDRQTGKTAIAIDAIINQKGEGVKCIYVAIGQKESKIANITARLEKEGAMEYTTIVLAGASDPASLSYIAPYAGCAIAEYFMDKGEDVLIVYDDLSKHAWSYREISLLLRRPPGREAYPGDVFYLHSRLLERSARLSEDFGGGSITALPIIETQGGDVSAYIPTNVISITDGQIYLESDLFYKGQRPALNIGLSVSRVGSSAQTKAMKSVAKTLKVDLAQFRELEAFAQFATDLDEATKKQLERGKRSMELMKQPQYRPISFAKQSILIQLLNQGYLDQIDTKQIKNFEDKFLNYLDTAGSDLVKEIVEKKEITDEVKEEINKLADEFIKGFVAQTETKA